MPSMISASFVWTIPKGSIMGASARVTGCCGSPEKSRATSPRHQVRVARATDGSLGSSTASSTSRQKAKRVIEARAAVRRLFPAIFFGRHLHHQCAREHQRPVPSAQYRPVAEHVPACLVELFKDPQASLNYGADFQADAAR